MELTLKEYELLRLLMENRGIAFSREQLLEKISDDALYKNFDAGI